MPFIGKLPDVGAFRLIDSITTSATDTYALQVEGLSYFPSSARNLIVSLNGVTQAPESAYTVSGSNIIFASALTASDVIDYILVIGESVDIGTPSDNTVGNAQLKSDLDFSGKNLTFSADQISGDAINGGTISSFASTGIDDNATSTAITIDSSQNVGIGTTSPSRLLTLSGSGATLLSLVSTNDDNCQLLFGDSASDTVGKVVYVHSTNHMRFETNSSEAMRIDSSGNVGIGTDLSGQNGLRIDPAMSADPGASTIEATIGVATTGYGLAGDLHLSPRTGTANRNIIFHKASGGTEAMRIDASGNLLVGTTDTNPANDASGTGVAIGNGGWVAAARSGDTAGMFNRLSSDGNIVSFHKDGTTVGSVACRSSGGNLQIDTVQSGIDFSGAGWLPMRNGAIVDNDLDLGSASFRFDDVYATNGTIQTSDVNEKQDIETLSEAETRVAVAAKALLRKFRWKSAVEEKGNDARIHFGIIAQDLQAAFEAEGLDAGRYAMFIHSTWTDEETGEERSRMGVRYSELLAFIIAAI